MERGVERTLIHLQHVAGDVLDAERNAPAVHRTGIQRLEDEQVERALKQVRLLAMDSPVDERQEARVPSCRLSRGKDSRQSPVGSRQSKSAVNSRQSKSRVRALGGTNGVIVEADDSGCRLRLMTADFD